MDLGLSSFTFGWAVEQARLDPFQLVERAQAWGVTRVQFGDNLPLHVLDSTHLDRLTHAAADAGIILEAGARGLTSAHLDRYLRLAAAMNAPVLRFVIDQDAYEPTFEQVVTTIRSNLPRLSDTAVHLCLENHDRWSATTYRRLVEEIAHPQVGICLDTANSLGAGEGIAHLLSTLAPYVLNLHLKDYTITRLPYKMGFVVEGRPAGAGMLDVPSVLAQVRSAQRCLSVILELWTPPAADTEATLARELDWARQSLNYVIQVLHSNQGTTPCPPSR